MAPRGQHPWVDASVIVDEDGDSVRTLALVMDQEAQHKEPLTESLTSIDEIETSTKLDFFWELEDGAEDRLEATKAGEMW